MGVCKGEGRDFRDKCKEKKIEAFLQHVIVNCFYSYSLMFENYRDFVRALKEIELSGNFQGILKCNSAQRNTIDSMVIDL